MVEEGCETGYQVQAALTAEGRGGTCACNPRPFGVSSCEIGAGLGQWHVLRLPPGHRDPSSVPATWSWKAGLVLAVVLLRRLVCPGTGPQGWMRLPSPGCTSAGFARGSQGGILCKTVPAGFCCRSECGGWEPFQPANSQSGHCSV